MCLLVLFSHVQLSICPRVNGARVRRAYAASHFFIFIFFIFPRLDLLPLDRPVTRGVRVDHARPTFKHLQGNQPPPMIEKLKMIIASFRLSIV
jgi:hypothetical protein